MLKRHILPVALAVLLASFIVSGQLEVPPVGDAVCVPVDPSTGAPCPECCDERTPVTPVEKEECVFPAVRDCNALCQHLQSYPTYEKEDCITQCIRDDQDAREAYDYCLANAKTQKQVPVDDTDIEPEEPVTKPKEPVRKTTGSKPAEIAAGEHALWGYGAFKENDMEDVVDEYFKEAKCPWNKLPNAWSAAFISYVMKKSGIEFPANCNHVNYFRSIKNKPDVCKTHPMKEIDKIQPGDIICGCRKAKKSDPPCHIDYDSLPAGEPPAHCDVVTSKSEGSVEGIGGNVADSVSKKNIPFSNPDLFGFITCRDPGTVSEINGDAKIKKGSGPWSELKEGTTLSAGHMVGVGKGGSTKVKLEDGTEIDLAESGAVTVIDKETYNVKTGDSGRATVTFKDGSRVELSKDSEFIVGAESSGILKEGIVEAVFDKLRCAVERCFIKTATATVAVRGTEFSLSHDAVGNVTQVKLSEGEIDVTDEATGLTKSFSAPATIVIDEKGITEKASLFGKNSLIWIVSLAAAGFVIIRVLLKRSRKRQS